MSGTRVRARSLAPVLSASALPRVLPIAVPFNPTLWGDTPVIPRIALILPGWTSGDAPFIAAVLNPPEGRDRYCWN